MKQASSEKQPAVVPRKYAGKYIVWNQDETKIIASGRTLGEARRAAIAAGESDPLVQKVPRADRLFIGGWA